MSTEVLTATSSDDRATRLDETAGDLGLPAETVVGQAVKAWADRDEPLHRLTSAALEVVGCGRVVDPATVVRRVDELCGPAPVRPS